MEKLAIIDEKGEVSLVDYSELDSEFFPDFCKPVGAFSYSMQSFMKLPLAEVPFYIHGWLPKMGKAEIFGSAKAGKSFLAVQLARCIGAGEPFLGIPTSKGRVLYIQFELGPKVLQGRLIATGQAYEDVYVGTSFSMMLDRAEGQDALRREIEAVQPEVLILDPLYKAMAGDENESSDMKVVCNFLDTLIEDYKLSILLLHHTGKDTTRGGRGSSVLEGWVDSYIRMVKVVAEKGVVKAKLKPLLTRHAPPVDEDLMLVLNENFEFVVGEKATPLREKIATFLQEMGEFHWQDVIDAGLCSRKTAYELKKVFEEAGLVTAGSERGLYKWGA